MDILEWVQFVCKPWYDLCKQPSMWRSIKFKNLRRVTALSVPESKIFGNHKEPKRLIPYEPRIVFDHERLVLHAVDRSGGCLVDLDVEESTQLKRLRLARCYRITYKDLKEALEKLTSLDELEITLCEFGKIISVIKSFPSSLTVLKLNERGSTKPDRASDKVALVIAERLPQLRHLQLKGNDMTNLGLSAILNGCPHLQSLDLRECFHLDLRGDLGNKLSKQFTNLQLPHESTKDCDYYTSDYDFDYDSDDLHYLICY